MPTFAVGAAPEYANADGGWGLPPHKTFQGCPELSWHAISIPFELWPILALRNGR